MHHSVWNELKHTNKINQAGNWPGQPAQILTGCNFYPWDRTVSLIPEMCNSGANSNRVLTCNVIHEAFGVRISEYGKNGYLSFILFPFTSVSRVDAVQFASLIISRWASPALWMSAVICNSERSIQGILESLVLLFFFISVLVFYSELYADCFKWICGPTPTCNEY